ncbi:hypothetical protein OGAPHI_002869 [Ogataea philodendri]|uniref:RNA polymerase II-associated protein 1 n=1 Tax=Ogataea philodendri TaxID=1378263 RepID=A0A9P8T6L3_9ASCO|nr:uncharacterized protein OGAPHI_002869 [Ogataea philodendri]KAH3667220.1 hypothetical protein OGAPHI_002869 [Ogataea philodendri]
MHHSTVPSSRQDFVAKVRYFNDLPPPPCPPKLVTLNSANDDGLTDTSLLSALFRKEHFSNLVTLDDDLGLPLSLIDLPECLEKNSMASIDALTPEYGNSTMLHPDDKILLTDPHKSTVSKSDNVSFLRRTQYISSDKLAKPMASLSDQSVTKLRMKAKEDFDPKNQVRNIEHMFSELTKLKSTSEIRHPLKKNLKAKRVWSLLPDTSMFDQTYYDIKFSNPALSKEANKRRKLEGEGGREQILFRNLPINETVTLMSFYTTSEQRADIVENIMKESSENSGSDQTDMGKDTFHYKKVRDYDTHARLSDEVRNFRHLAISFDPKSSTALYVPISGKVELKKCRIDQHLEPILRQLSRDEIIVQVREPTTSEIYDRDMRRSTYDPMEFGADEEENESTSKEI